MSEESNLWREVEQLLRQKDRQGPVALDKLVCKYGLGAVKAWRNEQEGLIHKLVSMPRTLRHAVTR